MGERSDPHKPWVKDGVPVRVARSALAPDVPHADLFLTKAHALFIDGALVTVDSLINGSTIAVYAAEEYDELEFFHIKLEAHDVIYAEILSDSLSGVQQFEENSASIEARQVRNRFKRGLASVHAARANDRIASATLRIKSSPNLNRAASIRANRRHRDIDHLVVLSPLVVKGVLRNCRPNDFQIEKQRPIVEIIKIVFDAAPRLFGAVGFSMRSV